MRVVIAIAMLGLCYLGACFIAWDFPNPYARMEPSIRSLWLIATVMLVGYADFLAKQCRA